MTERKRIAILTQGCKVNQYESEAIAQALQEGGYITSLTADGDADAFIVNTCTVTAESDRKAKQLIRRLHAKDPTAPILVTGCFAQSHPDEAAAIKGVDHVCGNDKKLDTVAAVKQLLADGKPAVPVISVGDVNTAPFEPMCIKRFDRTRAYVKIEDGCENRCSYCAIPAARGRVRSKGADDVVREVRGLVENGCREVVLTGIETASWGRDLDRADLAELLERVDAIEGIGRIRLGSLDPSLMRPAFVERIARLSHLAPHFHLSVQSGSSHVLAAMRRKYNRDMALAGVERLRAAFPCLELTADFIVGFPGESEQDFADTLDLVRRAEFLQIHVFAYSRRAGTVAADLPDQIPEAVKRERSAALIAAGRESRRHRLQRALEHPLQTVLFESFEHGMAKGHTDSFLEVSAPTQVPLHGALLPVRLTGLESDMLLAEIRRS